MTTTDKTPMGKAKRNYARFVYAKQRGHDRFIDKYDLCDRFVFPFTRPHGTGQWEQKDLSKLSKTGRPALTINKIKPVLLNVMGEYLANRADVKFIPAAGGTPETADALTKLYIHITKEQRLERKELDLVLEGLITSRAYYDVRIGFDDNFRGEVRVGTPNSKNVIPDPDADSDDPNDWNDVTLISHQTIQDIELNYGKAVVTKVKQSGQTVNESEIDADFDNRDSFGKREGTEISDTVQADETTRRLYLVIERQYKALEKVPFFIDQELGDERRVPVDWSKDDIDEVLEANENLVIEEKRAQVIRWTVSTGSVLLHDAISPYEQFTIIPYYPLFRRGTTSGVVEDLIDPQRNYNKLRSQELHIVNGTANSGWKVKTGALNNMRTEDIETEGSKTGVVFELNNDMGDIERIDPVQIPQGLDRISAKADSDLGDISGIQDEARGIARADVAGKAITARRQASLTGLNLYFEQLAFTRELLAKRILKLVQKYYDDERVLTITTGGLDAHTEELSVNQEDPETGEIINDLTVGEYQVAITSAAARDSFENAQFEELKALQELQIPVPSHLFIENSSLYRKEEIAEELRQIAGTSTPSEEERELQQMTQELELEEKRASIMARQAQAQLSKARARKVLSEIEEADLDDARIEELLLEARKLDNERFRDEQSMGIRHRAQRLEEARTAEELDIKREELRQSLKDREQEVRNAQSQKQVTTNNDGS